MIARCTNPADPQFKDYGGRGITVCARWMESVADFIADVSPRPSGLTMDRVDNDKGYGPDNFRWATRAEQQRNRRNNIVTPDGSILLDACAARGLSYKAVLKRVRERGWTMERALSTPVSRSNPRKVVA